MYNPFEPSCYRQLSALKRRRIEHTGIVCSGAKASVGRVDVLNTDELIRQRWQISADIGISRALETVTGMEEASLKAKVIAGEDRKSKMKSLLDHLSSQHLPENAVSSRANAAYLEFKSVGGSHAVVSTSAPKETVLVRGKPSPCILLSGVKQCVALRLAERVGAECSKFGVVRDVRVASTSPSPSDAVSIFIRLETLAAALKSVDFLSQHQGTGEFECIEFVPPEWGQHFVVQRM